MGLDDHFGRKRTLRAKKELGIETYNVISLSRRLCTYWGREEAGFLVLASRGKGEGRFPCFSLVEIPPLVVKKRKENKRKGKKRKEVTEHKTKATLWTLSGTPPVSLLDGANGG